MIAARHCRSRDLVSGHRAPWGRHFVRSARVGGLAWMFYSHRLKSDGSTSDYITESGAFGRLFSAERRWYRAIRRIRGVGRPL